MCGDRTPGPEGLSSSAEPIEDGTLPRRRMPAPGPTGIRPSSAKGSSKEAAGPAPAAPAPAAPVTITFVTQGDTRPTPYAAQFVNHDDMHWAQASSRYGTTEHIYQVDTDDAATWRLRRLYDAGIRASRVNFFGHGDDSGFFFSVLIVGDQITTNDEERRVFDRSDTELIEAIARIMDPQAAAVTIRFDGCEVGQNRQLIDLLEAAVRRHATGSGQQRFRISAPRARYRLQSVVDGAGQVVGWREPPPGRGRLPDRVRTGTR